MSKKNYYSAFFLQNYDCFKEKRHITLPSKIVYQNEIKHSSIDIAESLNDFFVSIGSTLEEKNN